MHTGIAQCPLSGARVQRLDLILDRAPALSEILAWVLEKDVNTLVPSEYRTLPYQYCK